MTCERRRASSVARGNNRPFKAAQPSHRASSLATMANVPMRAPLGTLSFNRDDDYHTVASTSFASPASKFAGRSTASLDDDGDRDAYAVASVNTPEMCAMADGRVGSSHELALSLVVERDRAIEREQEMAAFARAEMRRCDETTRALVADVEDLTLALGETDARVARMRWLWAIRAVVSLVRWDRERGEARKAKAKARRLATQLARIEKYVAAAACDFDDLNAKLVKEANDAKMARAEAREAWEMLARERGARAESSAESSAALAAPANPSTPPARRAANARRRAAKDACASVAAHVESLLANSPSKQLNQLALAQREAAERARAALADHPPQSSDGALDPKDVVALIAVHALERCAERSSSDGRRAFARAARRFETVARACVAVDDAAPLTAAASSSRAT